jgi:hypothetical protein
VPGWRCSGIDIGKRFLVCCIMTGAAQEEPRSETRRFDTTVPGLKRLRNWLNEERVTDVVMENTGSYWIPVFNLLEGQMVGENVDSSLFSPSSRQEGATTSCPPLQQQVAGKVHDQRYHD